MTVQTRSASSVACTLMIRRRSPSSAAPLILCSSTSLLSELPSDLSLLSELPSELFHIVALKVLERALPSVLSLSSTCSLLYQRSLSVRRQAQARALLWDLGLTTAVALSSCRRSVTAIGSASGHAWACASILPADGQCMWRVRIDESDLNLGVLMAGVCNCEGTHGWGLFPFDGKLLRRSRHTNGVVDFNSPPPEGFPDGYGTQLMFDACGKPTNLQGRAVGALVEFYYNADCGALSFRVDGGPHSPLVNGFPPNTHLRPWVRVYQRKGDQITLCQPFVRHWRSSCQMEMRD